MSRWTYIDGQIEVEPVGKTQAQKRYVLDAALSHLPIVSGSERDIETHIVPFDYYSNSMGEDEFGNDLFYQSDNKNIDKKTNVYDVYAVVLMGRLRDRLFDDTKKELSKWLCRLSKRVVVSNILVRLRDDVGRELIFKDAEPFLQMFELQREDRYTWVEKLTSLKIVSGDPYLLCQSVFGLEKTGLLGAEEIYNKYWVDQGAKKLEDFLE